MKRALVGGLAVLGVFLMLTSLYLLSRSTQNSAAFNRLHMALLLINALAGLVLLAVIGANLLRLLIQYRRRVPGSRLTARLVTMFALLAVLPVLLVYYFSLQFISRGIDSWFDVRVEQALNNSLKLSRTALSVRAHDLLARTRGASRVLSQSSGTGVSSARIDDLRREIGASELVILGRHARIIAMSSSRSGAIAPDQPSKNIMLRVRRDQPYVSLDPIGDRGLHIRAVVPIPTGRPGPGNNVLQALFPIAARQSTLAESVQGAYSHYHELTVLRTPLKYSFILTLSLILLLCLLAALWGAFYAARRLVAPIQDLAAGTRAVAHGDFTKRLRMPARDELGFLVLSFNEMTSRLAEARETARVSRNVVESERAYLDAVLTRLSSGVLALDLNLRLRTANAAAGRILETNLDVCIGESMIDVADRDTLLAQFIQICRGYLERGETEWQEEAVLNGVRGRLILICKCTTLPAVGGLPGVHVVVFDDLTALIQAQSDAAWGEVARRLAHEIKNPLTPIRLAAERLRRRYLMQLKPEDADILDRSTTTIVQQVDAMKAMVDAFSEYARSPELAMNSIDLNDLVRGVVDLYPENETGIAVRLNLDGELPPLSADPARIRQMLHNLLKNAIEALDEGEGAIDVSTHRLGRGHADTAEIKIEDNGPGFDSSILKHIFDPYVTSKPKGTGLGLAIVKKLAEEHGGAISAENRTTGGACVRVLLPVTEEARNSQILKAFHRQGDQGRQIS